MRQRDEAKNEVGVLKERLRRLLDQIRQYEGRVERTPVREQELMILIRDYDNMQKNYQVLLDKRLNARLAENLEKRQKGEQFRILDPANLPVAPESPNQLFILLGGLGVGCGLGAGAAYASELLRPAFRREEETERFLGVPVLAGIPSFNTLLGAREKITSASSPQLGGNKKSFLLPYRGKGRTDSVPETQVAEKARPSVVSWNVIAKWWPNSMITEQYRVAVTRLALMSREREHPVALITSSVMGEGKSTTTINLGHVFAQGLDKKTLIIDCDFKRPSVGRYLGVSSGPGLSDYWKGTCGIDACLHRVDEIPLWVLPSGTDGEQMFELSKIRQLEGLINELRPRFDQILLDAPPVFPLADLNFLSRLADMMVFVILAGKTNREVVEKALKALRPQCQVGIVLVGMESASIPHYRYHYDDRHDDRYVMGR
jgi:polysaccharide biosynthesis transport protein